MKVTYKNPEVAAVATDVDVDVSIATSADDLLKFSVTQQDNTPSRWLELLPQCGLGFFINSDTHMLYHNAIAKHVVDFTGNDVKQLQADFTELKRLTGDLCSGRAEPVMFEDEGQDIVPFIHRLILSLVESGNMMKIFGMMIDDELDLPDYIVNVKGSLPIPQQTVDFMRNVDAFITTTKSRALLISDYINMMIRLINTGEAIFIFAEKSGVNCNKFLADEVELETQVDEEPEAQVDEEPEAQVDEEPETQVDEEPEYDEEPEPEPDEEPDVPEAVAMSDIAELVEAEAKAEAENMPPPPPQHTMVFDEAAYKASILGLENEVAALKEQLAEISESLGISEKVRDRLAIEHRKMRNSNNILAKRVIDLCQQAIGVDEDMTIQQMVKLPLEEVLAMYNARRSTMEITEPPEYETVKNYVHRSSPEERAAYAEEQARIQEHSRFLSEEAMAALNEPVFKQPGEGE